MPPWQEVAAHLNAKHRAGSNIPRSALPSAVRAVAEPASIRCIWWKRLAADARPSPMPAGLDQGDARPLPFVVILESSKWFLYNFQLEAGTPRSRSCDRFGSRRLARLKFSR